MMIKDGDRVYLALGRIDPRGNYIYGVFPTEKEAEDRVNEVRGNGCYFVYSMVIGKPEDEEYV